MLFFWFESMIPLLLVQVSFTAQKMKFSIKNFFRKCDQIRMKLWISSHLLKKSLMENFIFSTVCFSFSLDAKISKLFLISPNHVSNNSTRADQISYGLNPLQFQNLHHCVLEHSPYILEKAVLENMH